MKDQSHATKIEDSAYRNNPRSADWKGGICRRFSFKRLRIEWGRYCFRTDCMGETRACWWEPETPAPRRQRIVLFIYLSILLTFLFFGGEIIDATVDWIRR